MADLFSVTAPLAVRFRTGEKRIMLRCFPYGDGLVFIGPFWNRLPPAQAFQVLAGPVRGDGPWKAGDAVITVLGCHGSDPQLANEFAEWQAWLQAEETDYPDNAEIAALADDWISRQPPSR